MRLLSAYALRRLPKSPAVFEKSSTLIAALLDVLRLNNFLENLKGEIMKLILSILCLVASPVFAANNACDIIKCGSYVQAPGDDGIGLTISFASTQVPNQLAFAWIYTKDGKDTGRGVRLTMKVQDDGSFTAYEGEKLYASGACGNSACTYGMTPITMDGKLLLQTGTFKFDGDNLEVAIFAPNLQGDDFVSKGILQKQK